MSNYSENRKFFKRGKIKIIINLILKRDGEKIFPYISAAFMTIAAGFFTEHVIFYFFLSHEWGRGTYCVKYRYCVKYLQVIIVLILIKTYLFFQLVPIQS